MRLRYYLSAIFLVLAVGPALGVRLWLTDGVPDAGTLRPLLPAGLILAGAAIVLALLCSALITGPVGRISHAARMIASGRLDSAGLDQGPRRQPAEFHALERDIRGMITRLRDSLTRINDLAYRDTVTELANRTFFKAQLTRVLEDHPTSGALLFLDLDGFKKVNDTLGHDVGDDLLREVANRIVQELDLTPLADVIAPLVDPAHSMRSVADMRIAARLGGDEFAVFLPEIGGQKARLVAQALLRRLSEPYRLSDQVVHLGCSFGLACVADAGASYAELLKSADLAMYRAKANGKNRIELFDASLRKAQAKRTALADEMAIALRCHEFVPHFQPQYCARTLRLVGVEALVRWQHPGRGLLGPQDFLDIAAEMNLVSEIDQMILTRATEVMRRQLMAGNGIPKLSVNISAQRLADPHLLDHVDALGPLPFDLHFELVESVFLDRLDDRMAWALEQLEARGVRFELDDFGSGHASMKALLSFRPQCLKIDRDLVARITRDDSNRAMVRAIVEMGRSLGLQVIAEGVETGGQITCLRDLGCDVLQGFALCQPVPAHVLARLPEFSGAALGAPS